MMKIVTTRYLLYFLLLFLGTGALFGGAVLIISPGGKLFTMPLSLLENSPFHDFLIPGIILFLVLGLAPVLVTIALIRKPVSKLAAVFNCYPDMYWAWTYSIYLAFALIIWIQIEMMFLRAVHWSHTLYMFIGIAIIFVALLPEIRSAYENNSGKNKVV